ncbi:MAG: hypothetical protein KF745_11110 [Phycisphaeraceae bacterium]|nr:hypothetical protein [Phycisphaeraceae bacterium]
MLHALPRGSWFLLSILAVLAIAGSGCDRRAAEVKESLFALGTAIENQDGEAASNLYSQSSIEYCDRIVKLAKTAKRADIASLKPLDRMQILLLRNRVPSAELKKLDGKGMIRLTVSKGWWFGSNDGVSDEDELGKIKVSGATAWVDLELDAGSNYAAKYIFDHADRKRYLRLTNEEGLWKVDTTSTHDTTNELLAKIIKAQGNGNIEQVLAELEERMSGKQVAPTVWDPPR